LVAAEEVWYGELRITKLTGKSSDCDTLTKCDLFFTQPFDTWEEKVDDENSHTWTGAWEKGVYNAYDKDVDIYAKVCPVSFPVRFHV
jgi:hypothetical protein